MKQRNINVVIFDYSGNVLSEYEQVILTKKDAIREYQTSQVQTLTQQIIHCLPKELKDYYIINVCCCGTGFKICDFFMKNEMFHNENGPARVYYKEIDDNVPHSLEYYLDGQTKSELWKPSKISIKTKNQSREDVPHFIFKNRPYSQLVKQYMKKHKTEEFNEYDFYMLMIEHSEFFCN